MIMLEAFARNYKVITDSRYDYTAMGCFVPENFAIPRVP
jgi:hypothetical protein